LLSDEFRNPKKKEVDEPLLLQSIDSSPQKLGATSWAEHELRCPGNTKQVRFHAFTLSRFHF